MAFAQSPEVAEKIKNTHVLIVEDEDVFRNAMVYEFRRLGFMVSSAENGKKAVELLEGLQVVHVVISDIRMPGGGGIELLKYIKDKNPTLPIVMMMTGFAELSSEDALQKGADALFSKPFDRNILTNAVMKLVMNFGEEINTFASSVRTDLKIKMNFNHQADFVESRAINLSPRGLFVSLDKNFPQVCDEIGFDMQLSNGEWWKAGTGLVRWVSFKPQNGIPSGVGIEFSHVSEQNKQKIAEIIKGAHDRVNQPAE